MIRCILIQKRKKKKKKKNEKKKRCCDTFMYNIFLHRVLILTFEGCLLGVLIIGDLCEV